ncbi:MAG: ankyrin repeat domain-containing protein, partial [Synergistaceae bacterium]|nr:ankyrin repeat domain-containing protein [Synergistaceae bacterium]
MMPDIAGRYIMNPAKFFDICASRPWPEIQTALKGGADPNAASEDGVTALMRAANNAPDALRVLLANGANVNARDKNDRTALMYAVGNKVNTEGVNVLLENGADVSARDDGGSTALIFAASDRPRLRIMRALIEAGADVNARNRDGLTPLMFAAARTSRPDVIHLLLNAGAEVDAALENGWTALMFAAAANPAPEVVRELCCGHARVNLRTGDRMTALMIAAERNPNAGVVRELIKQGADVNARDASGRTALIGAALRNSDRVSESVPNPAVIDALLDGGADVNVTWEGDRAFDIVKDSPYLQGTETLKRLESLSAKDTQAEAIERFLASLEVSPDSAAIYRKKLRYFFTWLDARGRDWPEREDLIEWRDELVSSHRSPTTTLNYLTVVRKFFQWAHQEGLCGNVAENIKIPRAEQDFRDDTLTGEQVKKMLDGIDRGDAVGLRDYALLSLIVSCGLSYSEVSRAKIGDIEKSEEGFVLKVADGRVGIPEEVMTALREYWTSRGDREPESPVFDGGKTHRHQPMSVRSIGAVVKNLARRSGVEGFTPGSLRHTAVKLALQKGERIEDAKRFARHRYIETTYRCGGMAGKRRRHTCGDTV